MAMGAFAFPIAEVLLESWGTITLVLAQFLWIRGASGQGILLASLHMNAVSFYVMVLMLDAALNWRQAAGVVLVASGAMLAQSVAQRS